MRHEGNIYSDMQHSTFLNSTCDIRENKRQRHVTLPFLKIDMRRWGPPIKGPITYVSPGTPSAGTCTFHPQVGNQ